jgi:hypothetical protein
VNLSLTSAMQTMNDCRASLDASEEIGKGTTAVALLATRDVSVSRPVLKAVSFVWQGMAQISCVFCPGHAMVL